MKKIIEYKKEVKSTADCVTLLNSYRQGKWKRRTKFALKAPGHLGGKHDVRVFSDGSETVTLISTDDGTLLCGDMDLSQHREIIKKINDISKFYYTHDYDNVWYDPYEKKVWVTGGDGGIFYSEKSPSFIKKEIENGGLNHPDDVPYFHEKIEELEDSTFEDECDPSDEDGNYILVGRINDAFNIGDDGEAEGMTMDAEDEGRELGNMSDQSNRLRTMSLNELKDLLKIYEKDEKFEKCAEIVAEIKSREK